MTIFIVLGGVGALLVLASAWRCWAARSREPRWWPEFEQEFRAHVALTERSASPRPRPRPPR